MESEFPLIKVALPFVAFIIILVFESIRPLFKSRKDRLHHGMKNILLFILHTGIVWIIFSSLSSDVLKYSAGQRWNLTALLSFTGWVRVVILILLFDLWMYIWHRATHEIKFLWRFHRMHHSDPDMDVTTALRFHPIEIVFSTILRLIVFLIIGMDVFTLIIYEMIMKIVIYFHHSNVRIPYKADLLLRTVILTPWMHWVHHSKLMKETNSNYGVIFSWWDRLGGSFRLKSDPKKIVYGMGKFSEPQMQTIWGMLKTPFTR